MSDQTDADKLIAVRAFAIWTEQVAILLRCSYADAAVFLLKVGPLVPLLQDATFRAQLTTYCEALKTVPPVAAETPQGKAIH